MEDDYGKDRFGNIDVPVAPPNTPGNPARQIMRLGMVGGRRADTDPTVAPVSDINNFVMLPDGSGMRVRDGFEFTQLYSVQTDPFGGQALMLETAPANVPLSFRHMIFKTAKGTASYVVDGEYVRDRSQSIGSNDVTHVFFEFNRLGTDVGLTIVAEVRRDGNLNSEGLVNYGTRDGTAIAGVDYTAEVGVLNFGIGENADPIILSGTEVGSGGKFFFIDLFSPSLGFNITQFPTLVVTINEEPPP